MATADILINIHPDLSAQDRNMVENKTKACQGVISANFNPHQHPHSLFVIYNPDLISSKKIVVKVQKLDPAATMAGL